MQEYYDLPMWIGGDLNLPNIDWENNVVKHGSYPFSFCDTFLELISDYIWLHTSRKVSNLRK